MKLQRRQFLHLAVGAAAFPAVLRFAGAQTARSGPTTVNMLHLGAVGLSAIVLLIAQRHGFFKNHGLDVRLVAVTGTQIPDLTDTHPVGHIGAPAAILKAARGSELRIVASLDSGRLFNQLVVNPTIKRPEDLQGKRLGARVAGAALWIHTVLALEKLGLDPTRDNITILPIGDPSQVMQALEGGRIEGAVVFGAQSRQLTAKGYSVLIDLSPFEIYGAQDALTVTAGFLRENPDAVEGLVAGLVEAAAFAQSAKGRSAVIETIKAELMIVDDAAAEEGLVQLSKIIVRKPYPSLERLRNMQRIMQIADPRAIGVDVANLVDNRFVKKLDESGFIDAAYAT
jgi:ABC-type nitrate/sulfonate/bicarbonate transport system substrate-binding protein